MRMNERIRIPKSVLGRFSRDINFFVSTDFCFMEAIEPKTVWISELDYEVLEEEVVHSIKVLLRRPKDLSKLGLEDKTKTEAFSSSRRSSKKRKSSIIPPIEIKQKNAKQEGTNIEEGRMHADDAQHEHETKVKIISTQDMDEAMKALQKVTP